MSVPGQSRQGRASCRSSHVRNAPLATVGPKKAACREGMTGRAPPPTRRQNRRRAPIGNISLVPPFARRRAPARGPDPLRIRNLPQVSATLRVADFCRRAVSGATFAYKNKPTMKSPPGCDPLRDGFVEQDLTAALRSLAEASGAADAAAPRQPRIEVACAKRRPDSRSHRESHARIAELKDK